jgi:hypothetical protein
MSANIPSDVRLDDLLANNSALLAMETMRFLALPNFSSQHHRHERQAFSQSNLVSDNQSGHLNAQVQDNNLINPWGIAFPPTGPFWIANNHTGTATLYSVDPNTDATTVNPLVVTIAPPPDQTGPAAPTGTVFNSDPNPGLVVNGKPALFIFATEDGTISAWNGGTQTTLEVVFQQSCTRRLHSFPGPGRWCRVQGPSNRNGGRTDAAVRDELPARHGGCVQ